MSEYEPITAELRELMGGVEPRVDEDGVVTAKYVTPEAWGEFVRRCDAIDAVHAALERENAELRERVAELDKRDDSMHIGGSITDELRKYANRFKNSHDAWSGIGDDLTAIADRIDAEMVEMPRDRDGVPIHVGDTLDGYGKTIEVVETRYGHGGWVLISRDGSGYADTFAFAHRHAPTVEDVLREFAYGLGVTVADSYVAAAAAKLRLAGDAS